jgi:hypothetical protein
MSWDGFIKIGTIFGVYLGLLITASTFAGFVATGAVVMAMIGGSMYTIVEPIRILVDTAEKVKNVDVESAMGSIGDMITGLVKVLGKIGDVPKGSVRKFRKLKRISN